MRKKRRATGIVPKPSVVLMQSIVPEFSFLLESEDIPIPPMTWTSKILIGLDFDESSSDALEICSVTGGDNKRVEVNERKMTDENRKLFRTERRQKVTVAAGQQSFRVVNNSVADKDRVM